MFMRHNLKEDEKDALYGGGCIALSFLLLLGDIELRLILFGFGVALCWFCMIFYRDYQDREAIRRLRESGELEELAREFIAGEAFWNGFFRFGSTHLFARGCGTPLCYQEISQIYRDCYRGRYYTANKLQYVDMNGYVNTVCKLPTLLSDEQFAQLLRLLQAHNPDITEYIPE